MNNETLYQKQIEREKASATAGYEKFMEQSEYNNQIGNASNNDFGLFVKTNLLAEVVERIHKRAQEYVGTNGSEVQACLEQCLKLKPDGRTVSYFDCEQAAFIGLQKTLDTALNPNKIDRRTQGKTGGDKKLLEKKTLSQLEVEVGSIINSQIGLHIVQEAFPAWFRKEEKISERSNEGGMKANTAYFIYRMEKSMKSFAEYLRKQGSIDEAELVEKRKPWTRKECAVIGALVIHAVLSACSAYITVVDGIRYSSQGKPRKTKEVVLTEAGASKEKGIREFVAQYAHDLLPMLTVPNPATNETLGGWIGETLQEKSERHTGSIHLSDKHLEFINRQARVKFQLNPFIYKLIQRLMDEKKSLGKFVVHKIQEPPTVAELCGLSGMGKSPEQDFLVRNHPQYKEHCKTVSQIRDTNNQKIKENMLAQLLLDKANKTQHDEANHHPMDWDFRGRVYSRVPFLSFQGTDTGKYLLRFAEKTPIDGRTKFWMKVGIANAAGNDKVCWDDRVRWFDKHFYDILNVGMMFRGGNFDIAYDFLNQDSIDDPFCLAALADEYVRVFVEQSQTYTQTYVYVDCSCSGTSIFNAWRENEHGARMTNLIDTPEPADIYMEVWHEIRRNLPEDKFVMSRIKKLEKSKLLRKMMKTTYVPASYASPTNEQHKNLREFNNEKLKPKGLAFKDAELEILFQLWDEALDKVSSINSVVSWFQARVDEALANGADSIRYTTVNGSVMTLKYPKERRKRVRTIHYGSAKYRRIDDNEILPEVDKRKMSVAITANITHATDASALCEALWDCQTPFVALHDAVGKPPGKQMDEGIRRLKLGLIEACSHSVWDTFRQDNGLPINGFNAAPIIGGLDLNDVIHSTYIFA
jgi:hypothetical protein